MGTGFLENQYKLDGAVAVVTGGSSGIGLATVRAFQGVGLRFRCWTERRLLPQGSTNFIPLMFRTQLLSPKRSMRSGAGTVAWMFS